MNLAINLPAEKMQSLIRLSQLTGQPIDEIVSEGFNKGLERAGRQADDISNITNALYQSLGITQPKDSFLVTEKHTNQEHDMGKDIPYEPNPPNPNPPKPPKDK